MRHLFVPPARSRVTTPPAEDSEAGSDLLAAARTAADAVSSGVASSAVSAANGRLGDLFAPSQASVRRGRDVEAAPPRRRDIEAAGQHQSAPPKHQPPWAQALGDGAETESARALPPVPSPPRLREQPPQPPDPPPLPNRTFLTDPNEEGDAGTESGELVMASPFSGAQSTRSAKATELFVPSRSFTRSAKEDRDYKRKHARVGAEVPARPAGTSSGASPDAPAPPAPSRKG